EVAAHLDVPVSEVRRLDGRVHRSVVLSLDATFDVTGGHPVSLGAGLVDDELQPLEVLEERERARYVRDALLCLPPRLKDVVMASFVEGESLTDIAHRLQVTESRVSQMRTEALGLMREAIAIQYGEEGPHSLGRSARRRAAYAAEVAERSTYTTRLTGLP